MSGSVQKPDAAGLTAPLRTTGAPQSGAEAAPAGAPGGSGPQTDQIKLGSEAAARAAGSQGPADSPPPKPLDIGSIFDKVKGILGKAVQIVAEIPAAWSLADALGLLRAVEAVPPTNRTALTNAKFARVKELPAHERGLNYGNVEFHSADLGGPLTIKVADIASQSGVVADVMAHEIGHAVQGGGRWDAGEIREFGKLSQWVLPGPPESHVNGYDRLHRTKDYEDDEGVRAYPKNRDNLVSDWSVSAAEDYAESYRCYLLDPAHLMRKAPEKFLYLNATGGKYNAAEVQRLAADAGVDLALTMAQLRQSTLRPETIDKVTRGNFLLGVGETGTAAGDAISAIGRRLEDPTFADALRADPREALGNDVWNRLSTSEQRLLRDPEYVQRLLGTVAANRTAPRDTVSNSEVGAWKDFFHDLANNPPSDAVKMSLSDDKVLGFIPVYKFGATPSKKPAQARFEYIWGKLHDPKYWSRLSPETRALIDSPEGKRVINQLANDKSVLETSRKLWGGVKVLGITFGGSADQKYRDNVNKTISRIGPAEVQFTIEMVKKGLTNKELSDVGAITLGMAKTGMYVAADGPAKIPGM
ncbi:MAG: hypothetical protein FJZ01_01075 [Candidatus Sericytochromatia bacterium]|nr:hypothetical protein [Candidatus Tanganyikabacteria bacterium]